MTQNAAEVFIIQLARAGAKTAHRFLQMRDVHETTRDDIIAAAIAWCWEHRDNYSLTTTLETWFMNAVRHAWESWRRKELPPSDMSLDYIRGRDDTYNIVAAENSAAAIVRELHGPERRVAALTMQGYTKAEMLDMGIREVDVKQSRAAIKRLRELLPDPSTYSILINTPSSLSSSGDYNSDDEDLSDMEASKEESWIDRVIAKLDLPPRHGKECPPCWRCMWFEGFMPSGIPIRMSVADNEVREAVANTEARKLAIAQQVRDSGNA